MKLDFLYCALLCLCSYFYLFLHPLNGIDLFNLNDVTAKIVDIFGVVDIDIKPSAKDAGICLNTHFADVNSVTFSNNLKDLN